MQVLKVCFVSVALFVLPNGVIWWTGKSQLVNSGLEMHSLAPGVGSLLLPALHAQQVLVPRVDWKQFSSWYQELY